MRAEKKRASPAIGFGTSFAGGMVFCALGGRWLDAKTGHESLFTLSGIGLGLLYGAWELWKLIALSNQSSQDEEPRPASQEDRHPDDTSPIVHSQHSERVRDR